MEAAGYRAETVYSTKHSECQVRLNRARQAVTAWSDADCQKAIDQLQPEIHQLTPTQRKLFDILFYHHQRQLLPYVGIKATGPRSIFIVQLALLQTPAEVESYGAVNMTVNK
jgi:hypothetical protein